MPGVKRTVIEGARNTLRETGIYEPAFRVWAGSKARARELRGVDEETVQTYLAEHDHPRLWVSEEHELAHPEWLAAATNPHSRGTICLRFGRRLPAPNGSFETVVIDHALEHHDRFRGELLLQECYRLLQPGGLLRIATMDLLFVTDIVRNDEDPTVSDFVDWYCDNYLVSVGEPRSVHLVNSLFRDHGHKFFYTEELLTRILVMSGYTDITVRDAQTSDDPSLLALASSRALPAEVLSAEALVIEARRA